MLLHILWQVLEILHEVHLAKRRRHFGPRPSLGCLVWGIESRVLACPHTSLDSQWRHRSCDQWDLCIYSRKAGQKAWRLKRQFSPKTLLRTCFASTLLVSIFTSVQKLTTARRWQSMLKGLPIQVPLWLLWIGSNDEPMGYTVPNQFSWRSVHSTRRPHCMALDSWRSDHWQRYVDRAKFDMYVWYKV